MLISYNGQKILFGLMMHEDFDRMMCQHVPPDVLGSIEEKLDSLKRKVTVSDPFHSNIYSFTPNSFRKHHWSTASILSTSLLVRELYRKVGRMQVLYSFGLLEMVISSLHHWDWAKPNVDISLQSGQFWATSIASFRERLLDFRSCWIVFIHVVRGRPCGLLQFCNGGSC